MTSAVASVAVLYALILPFHLTPDTFLERMRDSARTYNFMSVNAFNPWALVGSGHDRALIFAGLDNWPYDDIAIIGNVTGVTIGTILLASGFLIGFARLISRDDWRSIAVVGAYLSLGFFTLPTRVHERYDFLSHSR
jgi:hypothetical protein